jgi:release factor glutamine methyltransferase
LHHRHLNYLQHRHTSTTTPTTTIPNAIIATITATITTSATTSTITPQASFPSAVSLRLFDYCVGMKSVLALTQARTKEFLKHNVSDPALSAEYLMARVLNTTRAGLRGRSAYVLQGAESERFSKLCDRRLERVPIQYLVGDWDFRDLTLTIRPPVLIPRPETEELVGRLLGDGLGCSSSGLLHPEAPAHFLEVGPGSGAICLSILKARPLWTCTAIDISAEALALTRENAVAVGVADRLVLELADVREYEPAAGLQFDMVVSNPPYIPSADMPNLQPEVRLHEDPRALDGGVEGLDIIRPLVTRSVSSWLRPGSDVWLEVDASHCEALGVWCLALEEVHSVETFQDFAGMLRFCRITTPAGPHTS